MATKSLAKFKPDWSKLATKVHKTEVSSLNKLKSRVDSTAIKVASLPDSLPKIDWSYYKTHASDPKMVEEIEKVYSNIKIEPPKAPERRLNDLRLARAQDEKRFTKFSILAKSYMESVDVVKEKFEKMIPVPDMSMEEFCLTFPEWSIANIENPSIGPHFGRAAGISREEAIFLNRADPWPYSTKTGLKEWEETKKKFYTD